MRSILKVKLEDWAGFPLTTLSIWNKYKDVSNSIIIIVIIIIITIIIITIVIIVINTILLISREYW